jgi:hypothetical protein
MTEVEDCLICGKHIGKGNDPAVCDNENCLYWLEVVMNFNPLQIGVKMAREWSERKIKP